MTGTELLWPGGGPGKALDFAEAAEDLELDRLCALLFPGMTGPEALAFAGSLSCSEGETMLHRHAVITDLLENPCLTELLADLEEQLADLAFYQERMQENLAGMQVTRLDAAMDGVKKVVIRLERNLSKQGADILEESANDNRYAQLLRAVSFRRSLTRVYTRALGALSSALGGVQLRSAGLRALADWAAETARQDRIAETSRTLEELDRRYPQPNAFAVDVCMDGRQGIAGLEMAEVRSEAYARGGMLDFSSGEDEREGVTSLFAFPQTGSATLFQEYLLSEVGYEKRTELTKLRTELTKLPLSGAGELLSLRDALRFYRCAADFARKFRDLGLPVCAPIPGEGSVLEVQDSCLPELALSGREAPVCNSLKLEQGGVCLITGPNSSGKTSFLIQAGQLLFLAHLGCLIPGREASFRPRDALLTLFAAGESETGEDSRMGMEVLRIRELSARMTPRSIVLLNEPMTSTSAEEGTGICAELLCSLAGKNVPVMLVTHFTQVYPRLLEGLGELGLTERLQSLVMTVEEGPQGLRYLYKLREAPPPPSSHARAVVAARGVTLHNMLSRLHELGVGVQPEHPGWDAVRRGVFD